MKNARVLSTQECFKLLSDVRLGVSMGIISDVSVLTLNELLVLSQPATLQKIAGKQLEPEERDVKRAEMIRNRLQKTE